MSLKTLASDIRIGHVILGVIVGVLTGSIVGLLAVASLKVALALILASVFTIVMVASKWRQEWCMWAFLLLVPLPMHAFLVRLDPLHGGGSLGLYFVASDLPLILLYLFWFADWIRGVRPPQGRSNTLLLLLVPFLLVGTISAGYSPKPSWAIAEVVRWLKVMAVLFYVSKKLPATAVPGTLWAVGLSIVLESAIGVGQLATGTNLGLDKIGLLGAAGDQAVTQEFSAAETIFRGSALTGHPNFLAGYLLLVAPIFMLYAMTAKSKLDRWLGGFVFLAGVAGLLSTMSRAAWISLAGAAAVGFVLSASLGMLTLRRAMPLLLATVITAAAGGVAFSDVIIKRFRSDFSESWQLRKDLNSTAFKIANDNPLWGVGLNNYTVVYPSYEPAFADQMIEMDGIITVVHNVWALVLAEVGFIGLCAFLLFFAGAFFSVARAFHSIPPRYRPLVIGVVCGMLGAMAFDFTEIALWMDGSMYTLAFLVGLLAIAIAERARAQRARPAWPRLAA